MARKKSSPRRDWRMIVFLAISVVIVLSMVLIHAAAGAAELIP